MLLKSCIICYRRLNGNENGGKCKDGESRTSNVNCEETTNTVNKFFKFLERYLSEIEVRNAQELDEKGTHSKGVFEALLDCEMLGSCGDCLQILNEFCNIYNKMKEMELMLNWKLWTIKSITGSARKVGVRVAEFRKSVHDLVADEEIGDTDEISNAIFDFQREVGIKCATKLLEFPKVRIHRYLQKPNTKNIIPQRHNGNVQEQLNSTLDNPVEPSHPAGTTITKGSKITSMCAVNSTEVDTATISSLKIETTQAKEPTDSTDIPNGNLEHFVRIDDTQKSTTQSNFNITTAGISSHNLENETEGGTRLDSCDNYSPCNSIISSTAQEANFETNDHVCEGKSNVAAEDKSNVVHPAETVKGLKMTSMIAFNSTEMDIATNFSLKTETAQTKDPTGPINISNANSGHTLRIDDTLKSTMQRNFNTTTAGISSHNLENETEGGTRLDSFDNYSPCNSIMSATGQKANFETNDHIIEDISNVAVEDEKVTTVFGKHTEPLKYNERHSKAGHNNEPVLNLLDDTDSKRVVYDGTTKTENGAEQVFKEENSSKSAEPTFRSLRGINRCDKCDKSFSNKRKLTEHQQIHEEKSESDSDSSSFYGSFSDTEADEDKPTQKIKRRPGRNRKVSTKQIEEVVQSTAKFEEGEFPCEVEECTEILRTNEDLNSHGKLHGNFSCTVCKAAFVHAPELAIHEVTEHPILPRDARETQENLYYCPRPGCVFVLDGRDTYIQHHLYSHQQLNSWKLANLSAVVCRVCKLIILSSEKGENTHKLMDSHHQSHHHIEMSTPDGTEQETFKCDITFCTAKFLTGSQFTTHKLKIHGIDGPEGPRLLVHGKSNSLISMVHGLCKRNFFCCHFCNVSSSYAPEIALHEVLHHSSTTTESRALFPNVYQCPRPNCVFTVEGKLAFIRHYFRQHFRAKYFEMDNVPVNVCSICSLAISEKYLHTVCWHINLHYDAVHNMKKPGAAVYRCNLEACSAYFMTIPQLNSHQNKKHAILGKNYKCDLCNKVYRNSSQVKSHRLRVHKANISLPFSCPESECGNCFETERQLQDHVKYTHKVKILKVLNCPICDRPCRGKGGLGKHMKSHTYSTEFVCEKCGKKFLGKDGKERLNQHYLSHSDPSGWKFSCSVCEKKCSTKQKLEQHMRIHTKEKPFVCDICGEKYAHRHNLRIHVNNKHGDVVKDLPRRFDKSNLTSRKGVKRKKPVEPEIQTDTE